MARQEMWGIEKQGVTGMANRKRVLLRGKGGFRCITAPSTGSYCLVNPTTRHDFLPQKPTVSVLNDGISLKIYFKSLWKPEENQSTSCWEGQLSLTVILDHCGYHWPEEMSTDYKITLDFLTIIKNIPAIWIECMLKWLELWIWLAEQNAIKIHNF